MGEQYASRELRLGEHDFRAAQRVPDMEFAGPLRRLRSNFIDGIKEMPVRFTPESERLRRMS
jgi:hypothetical protein